MPKCVQWALKAERLKMNNEIKSAIKTLSKSIVDAQQKIKILKEFEELQTNGMTEEQYTMLCETPLSDSDILGKSLEIAMPFIKLQASTKDFFCYQTDNNNIKVHISKIPQEYSVCIVVENYINALPTETEFIEQNCHKNASYMIAKAKTRHTSAFFAATTDEKRAELVHPTWSRTRAKLAYKLFSEDYIANMVNRQKIATAECQSIEENYRKTYIELCEKRNSQQTAIGKYKNLLLKWTKQVKICNKTDNGDIIIISVETT